MNIYSKESKYTQFLQTERKMTDLKNLKNQNTPVEART